MRHTLPIALLLLTACPSGVTVPVEDDDMAELDQDESAERDMRVEDAGEEQCEPACGPKSCGSDGCNGTCGDCNGITECSAAGQCEDSRCWAKVMVNGDVVWETISPGNGSYDVSHDRASKIIGSLITIDVSDVQIRDSPKAVSCDTEPTVGLRMGLALQPAGIPLAWRGVALSRSSCNSEPLPDQDTVTEWNMTVLRVSESSLTTNVDIKAHGTGPRADQTLEIEAFCSVELTQI